MLKPFQKAKTREEKKRQTAQNAIPIKAIHGGLLVTQNNNLIKILKINSRNLELMSNIEMNSLFETYEDFLSGLEFPIQETSVAQPVDLSKYINTQKEILSNTKSEMKRQMLESYIEHAENYTKSQKMIQRQRYIIYSAPIKGGNEESYLDAVRDLEEKTLYIKSSLHELELTVEETTNREIVKYFHTFFDYHSAQLFPIHDEKIPQMITGGNE